MAKAEFKKQIERALLALGFSLMIGIMILGQGFRDSLGNAVGFIMYPLVAFLGGSNFHIVLFMMAAITALYAALIQKYTMDWDLMRNVQEKMRVFQKDFREAQLSNNAALMKKLEDQRLEMMDEQMAMSKQQFKPMAYISIISLPLFMWIYSYMKSHAAATMVFPFWGECVLVDGLFGPFQYWLFWYFLASMAVSQLVRKMLDVGGL